MIRKIRRAIKRSGETRGQGLKPESTTTHCATCNRVVRRDRMHGEECRGCRLSVKLTTKALA